MTASATQVADSPRAAGEGADQLARILDGLAVRNRVPGLAVTVFSDTGILAEAAAGVRAVDDPAPMTPRTLFRLTSLTKMLTALAAMRLADAGRLDLDERIGSMFPPATDLPATMGSVTVRQLLSHTAGLVRGDVNLSIGSDDPDGLAEYTLSTGIHTPFLADPGDVYSYSDQGYSLIGYLIERVTGSYFDAAMRELVFAPLGMTSACFSPLTAMTQPLSQLHVDVEPHGLIQVRRFPESARIHPQAGAFCSPHELARLGMLHLGDGIAPGRPGRIVSAGTMREMRTPRADIGLDIDLRYGLGAYVGPRYGRHLACGHEGYLSGTWTKLVLVPGLRLGVAWCDNRGPVPALIAERYRAINEIFAALSGAEAASERPVTADGADDPQASGEAGWPGLAGRYRRPSGRPVDVCIHGGGLCIADGSARIPLVPHHGSVYAADLHAEVPSRPPWQPHAGSTRCCVQFTGGRRTSYASVNGIVYRRDD